MIFETQFLLALVTTWILEIPVLIILVRYYFRQTTLSITRITAAGVLCTALTLPYLWFVLPVYLDVYYIPVGELFVAFTEALILNKVLKLDPKVALLCSFVMNFISFFFGSILL
ncbi:MAG TPA: hypothetical protein HA272_07695 [Methanoregula sp.]|nr:hypothetical protein [Methanoregula sp.]